MSDASASRKIVRPTLHHFGLTTANLEAMLDWYGEVLGMTSNHQTSKPLGTRGPSGVRVAWVSNDEANHRIAIVELRGLVDDSQRIHHRRLQHVAFEYLSVDGLLATYVRLRAWVSNLSSRRTTARRPASTTKTPIATASSCWPTTSATGRSQPSTYAPRWSSRPTRWALTSIPTR